MTVHFMIGHTGISVIFKGTEMFVTLKNLANLESCPANHFFPSFLYLKSNSPTQATSSTYIDNQDTLCVPNAVIQVFT